MDSLHSSSVIISWYVHLDDDDFYVPGPETCSDDSVTDRHLFIK